MREFISQHPKLFWTAMSALYTTLGVCTGVALRWWLTAHLIRNHGGKRDSRNIYAFSGDGERKICWCCESDGTYDFLAGSVHVAFVLWPLHLMVVTVYWLVRLVCVPFIQLNTLYQAVHMRLIQREMDRLKKEVDAQRSRMEAVLRGDK